MPDSPQLRAVIERRRQIIADLVRARRERQERIEAERRLRNDKRSKSHTFGSKRPVVRNKGAVIPMERIDKGRTRILIPSGLGDVYWTIVKFQGFCQRHGIADPYVALITTEPEVRYAGSEFRSLEFLRMMPFLKIDDPPNQEAWPVKPAPKWLKDLYHEMWYGDKIVQPGFMGYDYFLVYNNAITNGRFLEDVDDTPCNWHFPLTFTLEQEQFGVDCADKWGKYAVYLWPFCEGSYSKYHLEQFSAEQIAESIRQFTALSGLTPVFIGAWWDKNFDDAYCIKHILETVPGSVDLLGKTTVPQLFQIIKGCEVFVGCQCGPAIMAAAFGKKVLTLWAKKYPLFKFPNCRFVMVSPEARGTTWRPIWADGLTVDQFVGEMMDLYTN
jgi:hypothetical protein